MLERGTCREALAVALALVCGPAGCGRVGFESQQAADAGNSAASDAASPADAQQMATSDPWSGNFTMGIPTPVVEVNSTANEVNCSFGPDGLTMYFSADPATSLGGTDFYEASRTRLRDAFEAPGHLVELSSTARDGRLATTDNLEAVFSSARSGPRNLWMVTRSSESDVWLAADAIEQTAISGPGQDQNPWISQDGLRLYWDSNRPGGTGGHDVYTASRAAVGEAFSNPTPVEGLNSNGIDSNVSLSEDERFVVFASNRAGGAGNFDLYYARRDAIGDAFEAPIALATLNTAGLDWEPCLSTDGFLYFSTDRAGSLGASDIYRAEFISE